MSGVDMENAVAAGSSYGGYMMNWIQGHELGRRVGLSQFQICRIFSVSDPFFHSSKLLSVTTASSISRQWFCRLMLSHIC